MIYFLTVEQVVTIHDVQLESFGGLAGFRDIGLVEGMVARVENLHAYQGEQDLYVLAASLLLSIARGHGFNDANKRTAAASALIFLAMNSIELEPPIEFADYVAEAAQGLHDLKTVAEELRKMT